MGHTAPSATRSAATHIVNLTIAKAIRTPLWLLISAALARVLEPSGLGTWSMILAAAALLNTLLLHWTQSITQRYGRGEWLSTGRLEGAWSTRWPLLALGFGVVLALVLADPLAWQSRFYGLDEKTRWYVLPALATLWLMAECQGLQQVRERFGVFAWSPLTADLAMLVALGLLALAKVQRGGALDAQVAFTCLLAAGLLSWIAWLLIELRQAKWGWSMPGADALRRSLLFAAPLVPGYLVGYLAEWCDYFLIRHFYTYREIGLFHPAYQYMLILVGLPTAIATVLLPKMTAVADSDGGASVKLLIERRAPQLTILWLLVSLLVVAILPALLAWLLGPHYDASAGVLRVLLVAVPGAIVMHLYGVAYFVQGRLGFATVALFGVKVIVNFAVSFVLLPRIGVIGSAWGSAVSYLVLQWLFLLDQHRFVGLRLGKGGTALMLAHLSGVAFALVEATELRLLLLFGLVSLLLAWSRRAALFPEEDISALAPGSPAWARPVLRRLLCRRSDRTP